MIRLTLCLLLLVFAQASFAYPFTENVDYKPSLIKYYHSGAKVHIKLNNLPYGTQQVIVSPINDDKKPKVFVIGKRKLDVKTDNSIEFTVELEDLQPGTYNTRSSELVLTLFSYDNNDKLEILEKAKFYIRPIICSAEGEGVCALVKTFCHKGHGACKEKEVRRTFINRCEMKKHHGTLLYTGECVEEPEEEATF